MKLSALAKMKLQHTLGAVLVTTSAVFAQTPGAPAPITPAPINQTPPSAPATINPPTTTEPAPAAPTGTAPAVIEPPLQTPAATPGGSPGAVDPAAAGAATTLPGTLPPVDPNAPRVSEFQGDDISIVLRTLARAAQMNVVVSPQVQGTVTLRVEGKSPKDVIRIICQANGLVIDELEGIFYIKTQAEKAKEPTESRQYTFAYANAEKIVPLLQTQLSSGVAPQFDSRTNTVFYRETKSNLESIHAFLESIDKPTQQVMIEARLVEVNANPKQAYGINWGGVVGSSSSPQTFKYGGPIPSDGSQPPKVTISESGKANLTDFLLDGAANGNFGKMLGSQFAILSVPQMSATLRLLNEDVDAEFIANPRIVAANNQKATIKITRQQPVPQLNFNEQTAQAVFGGFEDKEFGNSLVVTPSINKDRYVSLVVQPEISNKVGDATFQFGGATVASPIIDKRTFESNVLIKSGDTLAIGGLLQDEATKNRSKVPVLGDIPLFGYVFQERVNSRTKRNLLVFVTPTIIRQGYGTGLEGQVSGLQHSGDEFADPNGWRNNAKGAIRFVPTSNRQLSADYPAPKTSRYKVNARARE